MRFQDSNSCHKNARLRSAADIKSERGRKARAWSATMREPSPTCPLTLVSRVQRSLGCPDKTRRHSLALRLRRTELHEESTFSGRSSPRRGGTDQNSRTVRHSSAAKQCGSPTPLVEHTCLSLRIGAPKTETVRGSHPDRVDWKRASERARKRSGEMIGVAIETSTSHAMARTRTSQPVREKPSARRTLMHAIAALNCKLGDLWLLPAVNPSAK